MQIKIEEDLIMLDLEGQVNEDILSQMADKLCHCEYVKESYKAAVIAREKVFATGLPTVSFGVAIPHTDIIHVKYPTICIARLKHDVDFVIMGEESERVAVKLVFMLAMNEQHTQLNVLQKLMGLLQDNEALATLAAEDDKSKIKTFIIEKLNLEGGE
jgi:PTS system galactitol-specific IIA component